MKTVMHTLSAILLLSMAPLTQAMALHNDNCQSIVGNNWRGTQTFKDPEACKYFNGCTHGATASIDYLGGNDYMVELRPEVGMSGAAPLICDNGQVSSPMFPSAVISLICSGTSCTVRFEDEDQVISLTK